MLCHVSSIRIFTPLGGIGVALFLFGSGFGLNESLKKNGLSDYWVKKVKRVFIPYAIIITLLCLFWKTNFNATDYLLDILGIKTSYWYIAYLLKWYVIFYISAKWLYRYRLYVMLVVSILMLLFFLEIEAEQSFSFLLGVWASEKITFLKALPSRTWIKIGISFLMIGTFFLGIKQLPLVREYMGSCIYSIVQCGIKLPLAIFVMAVMVAFPMLEKSRFLLFTGVISYELYLVHFPFYGLVNHSILLGFILLIASYIAAYSFHKVNIKIGQFL